MKLQPIVEVHADGGLCNHPRVSFAAAAALPVMGRGGGEIMK